MDDREKYSNDYMHMDRESLAEKSLSQDFSASNVGVITPVQHIHLSIEIVFSFFSAPIAH